jgi:hypothetical protein
MAVAGGASRIHTPDKSGVLLEFAEFAGESDFLLWASTLAQEPMIVIARKMPNKRFRISKPLPCFGDAFVKLSLAGIIHCAAKQQRRKNQTGRQSIVMPPLTIARFADRLTP